MPATPARQLRVLIAPDKFKGTLDAPAAASAIALGWHRARPNDQLDLLPITDGGDGFGQALRLLLHAKPRFVRTVDAAGRPCRATWWFEPRTQTAIIESANIIGLAMLPPGRFHPFDLDTSGLAAALLAAHRANSRSCLLGIGGSATNDAGFGLARTLGWQFLTSSGTPITRWINLPQLHSISPPRQPPLGTMQILIATDVRNRLLGPLGATRVYGPQKGIRPQDIDPAHAALRRLARITSESLHSNPAQLPGSGAAGGLGFGLVAFANGSLQPGFELFSQLAHLPDRVTRAQLVLTGEGSLDASSLMGKGVGELARLSRRHKVPCIGLAGVIPDSTPLRKVFDATYAIVPTLARAAQARQNAAQLLPLLAEQAARNMSPASGRTAPGRKGRLPAGVPTCGTNPSLLPATTQSRRRR